MKYLANHQIVEFNNCEEGKIDNSNFVRKIFLRKNTVYVKYFSRTIVFYVKSVLRKQIST